MPRLLTAMTLVLALAFPATAGASWQATGSGAGSSKASTLPAGNTPLASASGRNVTVSWTASALGSGSVDGYLVKRYDAGGTQQAIGTGCAGTIGALTCTEQAVPAGTWRYSVTPVLQGWRGAEGARSAAALVGSPSLTLSPATVTGLPAVLSGQVANFVGAQTVTFRLDNASTGTILSGSISPSPVPANGTASASVTLPAGTANGAHTVYAVGSAGDVASAAVTVAVPTPSTIATSAWNARDASAGGAEVNSSDTSAFAGDGRSATSGNFANAFATTRYVQYTYAGPLPAGNAASSVSFNLAYAGTASGDTTCFYFEVRRASSGAAIATHGSAGTPVDCTTGTSFKTVSTALPEVTSTDIADDLQLRVFVSSSGKHPLNVDLATVSGTASGQPFALYESSFLDSANGTAGTAVPWSLFASDAASYASAASWPTAFSSARYLKLSFPGYVPAGATIGNATFRHSYRSANSGASACYYFEVYASSTLIGTHGSAASPVSCNSSNSVWQTDAVPLPEVTSAAAANNLVVKLYFDRNSSGKSQHDLAQLSVTYTP